MNFRRAFCFVHLCFSSETARVRMFFFFQVRGFDRTTRTTLDPPQTLRQFRLINELKFEVMGF